MSTEPTALTCLETAVRPDWVDYNGHMNDAAYAGVFSTAMEGLLEWLGFHAAFRAQHPYTVFTLESHIRYLREAHEGQSLRVDVRLVDFDAKRLHVLMSLYATDSDEPIATGELMLMGMDTTTGRPAPFPDSIATAINALQAQHGCREWPDGAGRAIGIRRG